jgi:hypothetical protein
MIFPSILLGTSRMCYRFLQTTASFLRTGSARRTRIQRERELSPPRCTVSAADRYAVSTVKNPGPDPIYLGVMVTVNMKIGAIHPPVGLNLLPTSHIANTGLTEVSTACRAWVCIGRSPEIPITYVPAVTRPHAILL